MDNQTQLFEKVPKEAVEMDGAMRDYSLAQHCAVMPSTPTKQVHCDPLWSQVPANPPPDGTAGTRVPSAVIT